jgi:hypothetical protein
MNNYIIIKNVKKGRILITRSCIVHFHWALVVIVIRVEVIIE